MLPKLTRAHEGLRRRVLLASAICAVSAVPPVMLVTGVVMTQNIMAVTSRPENPGVQASARECEAQGGRWVGPEQRDGAQGYFYDLETGLSLNPDAPPLRPELLAEVQAGADSAQGLTLFFPKPGGQILSRVSEAPGPCSVLAITWSPLRGTRPRVIRRVAVVAVLLLGLSIALTQRLALGPLLGRMDALRRSARAVGSADFEPPPREVEDAISEVGEALGRAHQRIQSSEEALRASQRALERHVSDITHDLRTPIAGLQLILEELLESEVEPRGRVQDAMDGVLYLSALTENLREAARLEEGVHPLAGDPRVDLAATVQRVEARFRAIGRRRQVQVAAAYPETPVEVICDPNMAERVLANLVSNALAAADAGGHVAVALEREAEGFELRVLDDGPGLPPEVRARIGSRHLSGPRPRQRPGSGLGLSIVMDVVREAGWTISFEDIAPQGTQVRVRGPLTSSSDRSAPR